MTLLKISALTIGAAAAALSGYGAYEQAALSQGGYLMLAAPVVAAAAALIPYYAEQAWKHGHKIKALLWALILIPTAATVFFAAAERVHLAKAGMAAERAAMTNAVTLAERGLIEAKAKADRAEADAKAWRAKSKKPEVVVKWDGEATAARGRVLAAQAAVTSAAAKAIVEPPLAAPVWLLPMALDLLAFTAIWFGLSLAKPATPALPTTKRGTARKPKAPRRAPSKAKRTALRRTLYSGKLFAVIPGGKI